MSIDYSCLRNPFRYSKFDKEWNCYFCEKKSTPVYLFGMEKGGHFVCEECKLKIINHLGHQSTREGLINNKNILSGGGCDSNRRRH